jgi:hypothetical protein
MRSPAKPWTCLSYPNLRSSFKETLSSVNVSDQCWQCDEALNEEGWCVGCNMFPDDVCRGCDQIYDQCACGVRGYSKGKARDSDWGE